MSKGDHNKNVGLQPPTIKLRKCLKCGKVTKTTTYYRLCYKCRATNADLNLHPVWIYDDYPSPCEVDIAEDVKD